MRAPGASCAFDAGAVEVDDDDLAAIAALADQQVLHVQVRVRAAGVVEAAHRLAGARERAGQRGGRRRIVQPGFGVARVGFEPGRDGAVPDEAAASAADAPAEGGARHGGAGVAQRGGHRDFAQRAIGAEERGAEQGADETPAPHAAQHQRRAADLDEGRSRASRSAPRRRERSAHAGSVEQAHAAQRFGRSRRPPSQRPSPSRSATKPGGAAIVTSCRAGRWRSSGIDTTPKTTLGIHKAIDAGSRPVSPMNCPKLSSV